MYWLVLGSAINHNNFYFLILRFTSLHVSTSTGYPQVKYTQSFFVAILPKTDTVRAIHSIISNYII
jgi:hypothetical protein